MAYRSDNKQTTTPIRRMARRVAIGLMVVLLCLGPNLGGHGLWASESGGGGEGGGESRQAPDEKSQGSEANGPPLGFSTLKAASYLHGFNVLTLGPELATVIFVVNLYFAPLIDFINAVAYQQLYGSSSEGTAGLGEALSLMQLIQFNQRLVEMLSQPGSGDRPSPWIKSQSPTETAEDEETPEAVRKAWNLLGQDEFLKLQSEFGNKETAKRAAGLIRGGDSPAVGD